MNCRLFVTGAVAALVVVVSGDRLNAQQRPLAEGVRELAIEISASAAKVEKRRIAIVPFRELDGAATVLGTYLAEALTTNLFRAGGVEIVERAMLDKVLRELKLGESGVIDGETAKRIGKIVGVDAIVTGSITDLAAYVSLNCRMIDAETGRVFAAAETSIFKDDNLRQIMGARLGSREGAKSSQQEPSVTAPSAPPSRDVTPSAPAPVPIRATMNSFFFELDACRWVDAVVDCTVFVRNDLSDRYLSMEAALPSTGIGSRAYADGGREYLATRVRLGSRTASGGGRVMAQAIERLPNGVQVRAVLSFRDVPSELREFATLEIACSTGGRTGDFRVELRRVPIVH
jgi:curli biogenesis system outer membrane secretion channel CsgG